MEKEKTVILRVTHLEGWGRQSLSEPSCLIEIREAQTLDDLAETIITDWFRWLEGHLYEFTLNNKPYSLNPETTYRPDYAQDEDMPVKSTKTSLVELNLHTRQRFTFLFDFGDDHIFKVKVVGFGVMQKMKDYPDILETEGETPPEHPPMKELSKWVA